MGGTAEEGERIARQIKFGVGGDQARRLDKRRQQRPESCKQQSPFGQFVTPALSLVP
jgi:hypothetical protein